MDTEGKYHSEVCQDFLAWASRNLYGWIILQNNTGYASAEKVHYGMPSSGGGLDFFTFGPGGEVRFYDAKTNRAPRLNAKQKIFCRNMTALGFKCFVFREGVPDPVLWTEYTP